MQPSTNNSTYLQKAGKSMIEGMKQADPDAVFLEFFLFKL